MEPLRSRSASCSTITRIGPGLILVVLLGLRAPALLRRHDRAVLGVYAALWIAGYAAYWT
jgi:hypothetical protein